MNDSQAYLQSLDWEPVEASGFEKLPPEDQLYRIRHSCSHLLASAVQELQPDAEFAIGPPTETGFFYDIKTPEPLTPESLEDIAARIDRLTEKPIPFEHASIPKATARKLFQQLRQPFKLQILDRIDDENVGLYRVGNFVDLCAGPHAPSSDCCRHFKILTTSSAHWRGDAVPTLTRVSGTAWLNPKDLRAHLRFLEEAKKRDHRRLGPELELFSFHEWAASALWQPHGLVIRRELEALWRENIAQWDYEEILNPLLYRKELFECSGHWTHFQDDMFVFRDEAGEPSFALKPMNCPDTMLYFKSRGRSYRELPLRVAEGQILHRNENTGSLHGLMRARNFVQDDAHIFLTGDQVYDEIQNLIAMMDEIYGIFQLSYTIALSTRPENFMGEPDVWDKAEADLEKALAGAGKPFVIDEGEGAFYGPKIDFTINDSLGRSWQCATFQLDFQIPQRFDLEYVAEDGSRQRPIVIHRAIFGSFERFIGVLIEHLNGRFPTWLAPTQAAILPVSDPFLPYAERVKDRLVKAGARAKVSSNDSLNYRIRAASKARIPNILVVGEREQDQDTVSVRQGKTSATVSLDAFEETLREKIARRNFDVQLESIERPSMQPKLEEANPEDKAY